MDRKTVDTTGVMEDITMRKSVVLAMSALVLVMAVGCHGNKADNNAQQADSIEAAAQPDTTVYGVCGTGTSMHTLELITDEGDTLTYLVDVDSEDEVVKGGMLAGDRMAVVGAKDGNGEQVATQVLNLTTLLGRWTSIDKNFEIQEGGVVESSVKAESHPWTSWKIYNGNLLLNRDTFNVVQLGADSLYLENREGIYAFKRQQATPEQ